MPTLGMNQPGSTQSTPSRDRNPTYRSDLSSSQTASPSSLRVAHPSSSTASGPASSATSHVTVQSLLQQHASSSSPPMAALEFAVQERNTLAGQNTQLWKLIEKQRTGYAQLVKEIERVRGERDVYRGRLQFTGENTDALLRAHKESQRREGKEGSLRSAASSSHLKNSESSSSNGHVIGASDPRAYMHRSQSDDTTVVQHNQKGDSAWPSRTTSRERQGSQTSLYTTTSTAQIPHNYSPASQASSSTQLAVSPSDAGSVSAASSSSYLPLPNYSQDSRKPLALQIPPVRSGSLPSAATPSTTSAVFTDVPAHVSLGTSTPAGTPLTASDTITPAHSAPQSAAILLTPATPAAHASLNGTSASSVHTPSVHHSLHPHVYMQSTPAPSPTGSSAKSSRSEDPPPPPRLHSLSRDSHISLPEETKRYYATMVDSPAPSPQASHGFSNFRGESPEKLSPIIPQRRSESPLKQAAVPSRSDTGSASEKPSADRRAINPDNSEFLDLDADDTDTSLYDSVDDSGRASAVDSFDRPDYADDQARTTDLVNGSRKDKKRAVVEDFPLPPNTSPVAYTGNDGVHASHQTDMSSNLTQAAPFQPYSSQVHTPGDTATGLARSMPSAHHDLSDIRKPASQSQTSLPPPYQGAPGDTPTPILPFTFRSLPLLPNDLPHTTIQVVNSSIRPNDRGKDILSFIIAVNPGHGKESWNIEKMYSDVITLDSRVRASIGKSMGKKLVALPEGRLWRDHAPARVDQRKAALELYLRSMIALPVKNKDEIIAFFTSGVASEAQKPVARAGYKEGYLTKRGKNFGGWKTRYFVLQGPSLEYYESRGGTYLGSITITAAQIGRQQRSTDKKDSDEDNDYRHAFLIIEAKKGPGGTNARHVLCAESDKERDNWVELLVRYVTGKYNDEDVVNSAGTTAEEKSRASVSSSSDVTHIPNRRLLKDEIVKGSMFPLSQLAPDDNNAKLFQAPLRQEENMASPVRPLPPQFSDSLSSMEAYTASSLPSTSPLVGDAESDNLVSVGQRANSELGHYPDLADQRAMFKMKPTSPDSKRKESRRSMMPAKTSSIPERSSSPEKDTAPNTPRADLNGRVKISAPIGGTPLPAGFKFGKESPPEQPTPSSDRREKARSRFWAFGGRHTENKPSAPVHVPRAVFAVSLEESLQVAEIASLPAIVFRCIQYLEAKSADQEEGIYRLSGSSAVIKALKDRFNNEGDVDLLVSDEHWDPHAISGLLKTFLRELPASILTRDLHLRFLSVIDFVDPQERITELSQLIAALPIANYSLLRALTAHLILIVQNAHVNKMTMRNVGIVFSPTLGIPAGVFSLMLGEFKRVFSVDGELDEDQPVVSGGQGNDIVPMNRRNSKRYSDAAADEMLGLTGRTLAAPEDGQSDEGEDLSVHDESDVEENTESESAADSSLPYERPNYQNHLHPSDDASTRSRASNVAASRGLNISTADKASRRHSRMVGLPHSPRPQHGSPHSPRTPQNHSSSSSPNPAPPSPLHTPR